MTKYKKLTEQIFSKLERHGWHVKDAEYGNYYMLFELDIDAVVHFRIKELKHWKFGIWWSGEYNGKINFNFFTEHDDMVDKFKPSAVAFHEDHIMVNTLEAGIRCYILPLLNFLKKHPYRAWSYAEKWSDSVMQWCEHDGCFKRYWHYQWKYNFLYQKFYNYMCKKYQEILTDIGDWNLIGAKIVDGDKNGAKCSPRFDLLGEFDAIDSSLKGFIQIDLEDKEVPLRIRKKVSVYKKKWKWLFQHHFVMLDIELGKFLSYYVRRKKW